MSRKVLWIIFLTINLNYVALSQNRIGGRVIDAVSNSVIEYATITLHSGLDSSLIDGMVTDNNGLFEFSDISTSSVYVTAQFLGFKSFSSSLLSPKGFINLGTIPLSLNAETLDEIEVSGKQLNSVHKLDKQVYSAKQFEQTQGGTASDILSNLPSISINSFGEISVRGATGFLLMINGKPVQVEPVVMLQQIAANSIKDIEIITAPSAKYDPDGNAGIINIITIKPVQDGFYLSANLMAGLPSIQPYDNRENSPKYGADLTANFKSGQWTFSGGLDYRRYDITGQRIGYVNTYLDGVLTEFPSYGERSFDEENYTARFSANLTPNFKNSFTLGVYAGKRTKERTADILYPNQQRTRIEPNQFPGVEEYWNRYDKTGLVTTDGNIINSLTFFNENLRVRKGDFFISSLDYSLQFSENSSLTFSALYERTILGGPTDNANLEWPNTQDIIQLQFNDNDNPLDGFRFQTDYSTKVGNLTWESGYQFKYLKHPGDFIYLDRDLTNNSWVENPLFTNKIDLTRNIHSLYNQLSGSNDKWEYSFGLRMEYFDRQVKIDRPKETYNLDKFNLFPSLNLKTNLGDGLSLKAGYSRRIERTTTFKMTPFPEREHSETLEQGDAELLPEYIDIVELGLVKNWNKNELFITGYHRNVKNVINRVNTVFNDSILNRIYTNAGTALVYGVEVGTSLYPTDWWRFTLGGNLYDYTIKGTLFNEKINTSNTIFSINANTNFDLSSTFTMQLTLNYLSERVTAQGRDSRFYNPSLSLRKTFAENKYALSLQWINIDMGLLESNEQRITTIRDNFYTTTNYIYEVDIIRLGFSYSFNQPSKNVQFTDSEFGKNEF